MSRFKTKGRVKRKKDKYYSPKFDMTVSDPRFEVIKPKIEDGRVVPGERLGQCVLTYSVRDRDADSESGEIETRLPLVAVWVSPIDGEVVKAHLTSRPTDVKKIGGNWQEAKMFYEQLLFNAKQAMTNRQGMSMIASSQLVMRYGRPHNNPYDVTEAADGGYVQRKFYDSKALAIAAILGDIKRKNQRNIGGVSTASFMNVPDELLLQVGFVKVPDFMGRSVAMWMGDPSIVKDAEYEASYSPAAKKKLEAMLETFLSGLQRALQS